jgi:glutamate racemase
LKYRKGHFGPIAIIDYGIGGLGLYKMIRKDFPKLPLIYFSDSGEVPYGRLSKARLRARIGEVFHFLQNEGVEKIIVACHSASSVVRASDTNVIGLRSQTVRAVTKTKARYVGIIGGGRTIRSGFYRRELNKIGIKTSQRIAQPLSILVERGEVKGKSVEEAVKKIMAPLADCDSVLLACTHYPVLSKIILKYVPKGVRLIDPIDELYKTVYKDVSGVTMKGRSCFMTTGDPRLMQRAAWRAFGVKVGRVKRITIR